MSDKIAGYLGLCRKKGSLIIGGGSLKNSAQKAVLVIFAEDLAENSRRKAESYLLTGVNSVQWGTKESLGAILGRKEAGVVIVTDANLAQAIIKTLKEE